MLCSRVPWLLAGVLILGSGPGRADLLQLVERFAAIPLMPRPDDRQRRLGEPLAQHRRMETCVNTVYHDEGRASCIVLPIVPAGK